jgi:hypothetical protein
MLDAPRKIRGMMTDFQDVVDKTLVEVRSGGGIGEEDLNLDKIALVAMVMSADPRHTRELALFEVVATTAFLEARYPKVSAELTEFTKKLYSEMREIVKR